MFYIQYGSTSLHWACDKGHLQVTELLIEHGAALEAVTNV